MRQGRKAFKSKKGISGSREGELGFDLIIGRRVAVRAAGLAGQRTSAERLFDDALDGTRTAAAFGTATKAAVKLLGATRKVVCGFHGVADVVIAQHIAGTDNH